MQTREQVIEGLNDIHAVACGMGNDQCYLNSIGIKQLQTLIHMPREAARLFLKVKDVRIERLQDMSAEDCANDGGFAPEAISTVGIVSLFGTLWNSTIKSADLPYYCWDANPWVWVVEFERVEK